MRLESTVSLLQYLLGPESFTLKSGFETPNRIRSRVRTTVRREGRITKAQQQALDDLLPQYRLKSSNLRDDFSASMSSVDRIAVEIGFGNGDALLQMATSQPTTGFVGIEIYRPGIGHFLRGVKDAGLNNVRVFDQDGRDFFAQISTPDSIDEIYILFPDPWPKKRHHKRRLIQKEFLETCANRLKPGGLLCIATDWKDYAQWILNELAAVPALQNANPGGEYYQGEALRPTTRYERKALESGATIYNIVCNAISA